MSVLFSPGPGWPAWRLHHWPGRRKGALGKVIKYPALVMLNKGPPNVPTKYLVMVNFNHRTNKNHQTKPDESSIIRTILGLWKPTEGHADYSTMS